MTRGRVLATYATMRPATMSKYLAAIRLESFATDHQHLAKAYSSSAHAAAAKALFAEAKRLRQKAEAEAKAKARRRPAK